MVQALKALGRDRVDQAVRNRLLQAISAEMWVKMVRDTKTAPAWVHEIIRTLAEGVDL